MKTFKFGVVAGSLFMTNLGAVAVAADMESTMISATENTAALDFASSYIFRGTTRNEEAVMQPSLGVDTDLGVSFGLWGNVDLTDQDGTAEENQFSEVDLTLSYVLPLPMDQVSVSVGGTEYIRPQTQNESDREVSISVVAAMPMNPSVSFNYGVGGDIDQDLYTEFGLDQEIYSNDDISTGVALTIGHITPDSEDAETGFTHGQLSANVAYKMFNVSANYIIETDDKVNSLEDQEEFFATIGAGTVF